MTKQQSQALPFKKKVSYFFSKTIWSLLLGVYVLALLGAWIYQDYIQVPPVLKVEMVDGERDSADSEAFEEFMAGEGYAPETQRVGVSKMIQVGPGPRDLQDNQALVLYCALATRQADVYFWNDPRTGNFLSDTDLIDLRTVLPQEVLQDNLDRLVFTGPLLDGGYPCGVYLESCPWIQENGFYEDCTVGISKNAEDPKLAVALLRYLLQKPE